MSQPPEPPESERGHSAAREGSIDPLTGLPDRYALRLAVESSVRDGGRGALIAVNLDHFRYVNDNFGHQVGDRLLISVGGLLRDLVGEGDGVVHHLGGDEFVIHLPGALREQAGEAADRMLDVVCHHRFQTSGEQAVTNLSASAGAVLYPFHGDNLSSLLTNLDLALYEAKALGRNRCVPFEPGTDRLRVTRQRTSMARMLRDALDAHRLVLFSQPVVRLADRMPMHHEVLVRIPDDGGGYLLPGSFLALAESLSMIQELDLGVVDHLLEFMERNGQAGRKLRYCVNLSGASIGDRLWVGRLTKRLRASQVVPGQLVFEVSETAAMSDVDATLAFIRRLKALGCRFALGDFGAGFSSLRYLTRFEVDYLKVAGRCTRELATDEGQRIFFKVLNDAARGLKKQVIAEWVESPEVLRVLLDLGAEYGQGYLFRRPQLLVDSTGLAPPAHPAIRIV